MLARHTVVAAFGTLGFLAPLSTVARPPPAQVDDSSPARTRGLHVRMDAGVSWNQYKRNPLTVRSILAGPTVSIGAFVSPRLVLGGGIGLHVGRAYDYEHPNNVLESDRGVVIWPRAFAVLDYYPGTDEPIHVGLAGGYGVLTVVGPHCDCSDVHAAYNDARGVIVAPHAGFDWPTVGSWSFGPLVRVWLSYTSQYGATGFVVAPELAFSASYR